MYRPAHFDLPDPGELQALVRAARVAHLVTHTAEGFDSSVLPLLLDPDTGTLGHLIGHWAKANPQWHDAHGLEALAIFTLPDAYISPSGFATKAETGKVVPTWNYTVVHAHGIVRVHDDPAWLDEMVRRLTDHHEAERAAPWSVDDAPADYIQRSLNGIVGLELEITRLEGKAKLSQNRTPADIAGAVADLRGGSERDRAVADAMAAAAPA